MAYTMLPGYFGYQTNEETELEVISESFKDQVIPSVEHWYSSERQASPEQKIAADSPNTAGLTQASASKQILCHSRMAGEKVPEENGKKKRHLVRWNDDLDKQLLLAILATCNDAGIILPWEDIAHNLGAGSTPGAITQHVSKLRQRMVDSGMKVPPPPRRGSARSKPAPAVLRTPIRRTSPRKTRAATAATIYEEISETEDGEWDARQPNKDIGRRQRRKQCRPATNASPKAKANDSNNVKAQHDFDDDTEDEPADDNATDSTVGKVEVNTPTEIADIDNDQGHSKTVTLYLPNKREALRSLEVTGKVDGFKSIPAHIEKAFTFARNIGNTYEVTPSPFTPAALMYGTGNEMLLDENMENGLGSFDTNCAFNGTSNLYQPSAMSTFKSDMLTLPGTAVFNETLGGLDAMQYGFNMNQGPGFGPIDGDWA